MIQSQLQCTGLAEVAGTVLASPPPPGVGVPLDPVLLPGGFVENVLLGWLPYSEHLPVLNDAKI